jgi:SAM-dependent methyltransferase
MSYASILGGVQRYYSGKIEAHGPTARGVDWNSPESQGLRFVQLLKLIDRNQPFTINDYGCGYGALADHLHQLDCAFQYRGFDISPHMIARARELHDAMDQVTFINEEASLTQADYTIASGIFNVRLQTPATEWEKYVLHTLKSINALSEKGFAFNILTKYSDAEFMRPDLYYADPLFFFDYCKRTFSRFVSLLHDYPLYEFTILVRKE